MMNLTRLIPVLLITGCVSTKPASHLAPGLAENAVLITEAVIIECSFVTNNYDMWWKGSSDVNCIEPVHQGSNIRPPIRTVPAGYELQDLKAHFANGIDNAQCFLTADGNGSGDLVIWDVHIEQLLGVAVEPRKRSWFCQSTLKERLERDAR